MASPISAWAGEFGTAYHTRNRSNWQGIKNRARLFEDIIEKMGQDFPKSVLEVGAGVGDNLRAIDMIYERTRTPVTLSATEPSGAARDILKDIAKIKDLALDENSAETFELVFTSGVLIHIPPSDLPDMMRRIHYTSRRWILSIEYFNPTPDEVPYRGQSGMLWRRDFGSEWMKAFPSLKPVSYGFCWKPLTGLDDLTWWLFRKD